VEEARPAVVRVGAPAFLSDDVFGVDLKERAPAIVVFVAFIGFVFVRELVL
jgi:hypothetical protein